MMGKTHIVIGVAAAAIIFNNAMINNPKTILTIIGVSALASLLTDIDTPTSIISNKIRQAMIQIIIAGACLVYISKKTRAFESIDINSVINKITVNPQILIGIILLIIIMIFSKTTEHRSFTHSLLGISLYSLSISLIDLGILPYFILGYGLHIFADYFTDKGIELLYPYRKIIKLPVIKTNSISEYMIRYSILAFIVYQLSEPIKRLYS